MLYGSAPVPWKPSRRRLPSLSWRSALFACAALCVVLAFVARRLGTRIVGEYDEGVYLATFRAIEQGFAPYREAYLSQPPGFLVAVYPIFSALGSTLEAGRAGVYVYALLGLFALVWLGSELGDVWAAFIAVGLAYACPLYLKEITTFHGDAVPATFSTLALAAGLRFRRARAPVWAALCAFFLVCAVLIKSDLSTLPTLMIAFVSVRARRDALRGMPVFAGAGLASTVIFIAPFGASDVYENVVALRIHASAAYAAEHAKVFSLLRGHAAIVLLTSAACVLALIASVISRAGRRRLMFLAPWLVTTFLTLRVYKPLQQHHLVFLVVPAAATAAWAFTAIVRQLRAPWLVPVLASVGIIAAPWQMHQYASSVPIGLGPKQRRGIALVQRYTEKHDFIICDDGIVTALSERRTPPRLTDLSRVRIQSGGVSRELFVSELERYQPKLIMNWAGHIRRVPDFDAIMAAHHYVQVKFKKGETPLRVYLRQ